MPYCVSLIMVTTTIHITIVQSVHFTAVKFTRGSEKNVTFLLNQNLTV